MSISLYPYQLNAIEKMFTAIFYNTALIHKYFKENNDAEQPENKWTPCVKEIFLRFFQAHLHMPTGSGKTFIVLGFINKLLSRHVDLENFWSLNKNNTSSYQYYYGSNCTYFIDELNYGSFPYCEKRKPSGKYMIVVPRSVAFQWKEKAKAYFGDDFYEAKVVCLFSARDMAKISEHKLVYVVSDQLRPMYWNRIDAKFDVVFYDESHGRLMKKILEYCPFFVWHMNADRPPEYEPNSNLKAIVKVEFKPVVRTIDEQALVEFLNLPPVNEQRVEFSISRYLNIIKEISDRSDWSFLFYLSIVPQNRVKQVLVDMHSEITQRIEDNKSQIYQCINESNAAKRIKLTAFAFFAQLNETNNKKIQELEKLNRELTERIENINYKLAQIECVVCKMDIEEQNQVHFNCCKNMCCLTCIQLMIKSNHVRCPMCREDLGPTVESIKRSMEQTQTPESPVVDGFLESFRRIFNNLNSDKILIVFAHADNLNESFFQREFDSLLSVTDARRSHFLTNAGGATGIGNHVTRFREDPQLRVLYINAKYCFFGLDLEFVDDAIILAENLIPDTIYNQLIGRVQRNGRKKPLTVYKMIGV